MIVKGLIIVVSVLSTAVAFAGPPVTSMAVECNWGQVTADAIHGGFDQGPHASDPSGDGLGPEDRVGLANVFDQGNLQALCEFISESVSESVSDSSQPLVTQMSVECNWGLLTMEAIQDGFDQGAHASDPSGDGLGPEDRVGLANVVEQGNLQALCEFLAGP